MLNFCARVVGYFGSVCVGAFALSSNCAQAQVPGSYDTTFGATNGYISALAIGSNDDDRATAIALQPDGKIILAGVCAATLGNRFCLARLMPDGALDTSFIGPNPSPANGKFLMTIAGALAAEASAIAVQSDGKILVAGTCNNMFCIARLNENGTFDASFVGPSGTASGHFSFSISVAARDSLNAMALQADGKIVLVGQCDDGSGSSSNGLFCAARLRTDGSLDVDFDGPVTGLPGNGKFLIPRIVTGSAYESARAVVIRTSGKILIGGSCIALSVFCLAQLNASGAFDATFDGSSAANGRFALPLFGGGGFPNSLSAMVLQADDYVVLGGNAASGLAVRLSPSGVFDPTFGRTPDLSYPAGVVRLSVNVATATIQNDGKLLFGSPGSRVGRTHSDGTDDLSFDGPPPSEGDGNVSLTFAAGSTSATRAIAVQRDGKIVIAGYCDSVVGTGTSHKFCVARLHGGSSAARNCSPDIDGDGRMTATIDALINTRVMLGLTGAAVTDGISFPANATRNSWGEIRTYLVSQCGMNIP